MIAASWLDWPLLRGGVRRILRGLASRRRRGSFATTVTVIPDPARVTPTNGLSAGLAAEFTADRNADRAPETYRYLGALELRTDPDAPQHRDAAALQRRLALYRSAADATPDLLTAGDWLAFDPAAAPARLTLTTTSAGAILELANEPEATPVAYADRYPNTPTATIALELRGTSTDPNAAIAAAFDDLTLTTLTGGGRRTMTYTYYPNGLNQLHEVTGTDGSALHYTYTPLGQVDTAIVTPPAPAAPYAIAYTYDRLGRTSAIAKTKYLPAQPPAPPQLETHSFEVHEFTYYASTWMRRTATLKVRANPDADELPTPVTTTTQLWDGFNCVSQSTGDVTTDYAHFGLDPAWQTTADPANGTAVRTALTDALANVTGWHDPTTSPVPGPAASRSPGATAGPVPGPTAGPTAAPAAGPTATGPTASPTAGPAAAGVTDARGFDGFGNIAYGSAASPHYSTLGYRGQLHDASTAPGSSLVFLRNRYYDPNVGQFTSLDPIRSGTNWYAYPTDPINSWDPMGLLKTTVERWAQINGVSADEVTECYGEDNLPMTIDVPDELLLAMHRDMLEGFRASSKLGMSESLERLIGERRRLIEDAVLTINSQRAALQRAMQGRRKETIGPPTPYFRIANLTLGSELDPASPLAAGIAEMNGGLLLGFALAPAGVAALPANAQKVLGVLLAGHGVYSASEGLSQLAEGDPKGFVSYYGGALEIFGGVMALRGFRPAPVASESKLRAEIPHKPGNTISGAPGETDKFGNITIRPDVTGRALRETLGHEGVHRFFSPRQGGVAAESRANFGIGAYQRSHLVRYVEEAVAETIGTGSIRQGVLFPFTGYDISKGRLLFEAAAYVSGTGAAAYMGYEILNKE